MKYCFALSACSLLLLAGCKGTVEVDCNAEPGDSACIELCTTDPALPHCSATDGGADAGPGDGGTDAGPDVPTSNCTTECEGMTPICDESNAVCVQCLEPVDCAGVAGRPMCFEGACVECSDSTTCTTPTAPVCATEGDDAGTCVPCTVGDDTGCADILDGPTALGVCADTGAATQCVACAEGAEDSCTDAVCDLRPDSGTRFTCQDERPDEVFVCGECISNSECPTDQVCVSTSFMGTDTGYRCQWAVDPAAPDAMADCSNNHAPFLSATATGPTAGTTEAQSCMLRRTSCEGWLDFQGGGRGGLNCEASADCGLEDVEDATCGVGATMFCTMPCGSAADCVDRTGTAFECGGGGGCTFTELP